MSCTNCERFVIIIDQMKLNIEKMENMIDTYEELCKKQNSFIQEFIQEVSKLK